MTLALLTNSRLRSRRDCARKHHLEYVEGWRPTRTPEYFAVGRLFHAAMETWWGAGLEAALATLPTREEGADPYRLALVTEIVRAYDARWAPDRERYEVLANEATFRAPLLNPETWAASRTFELAGTLDKIVRDRETGRVLLVEHKTTSEAIEEEGDPYWAKLAMDSQVSHYFIGAEALGHRVEGCLYDVAKKPGLRPLKANTRRAHDETPEEYGERVRANVTENAARYYQRREVTRLESQIRDHLHDVWTSAAQIREDERLGRSVRNPDACHRYGECAFWQVCAYGVKPAESHDYEKADPFRELHLATETPAGLPRELVKAAQRP